MIRKNLFRILAASTMLAISSLAYAQSSASSDEEAITTQEIEEMVETEAPDPTEGAEEAAEAAAKAAEAETESNEQAMQEPEPKADQEMVLRHAAAPGMMGPPEDETHLRVYSAFRERLPGVPIESLSDAAMPGLYEVVTNGQVIYVNETLSILFQGEMIDLTNGVNLTQERLTGIHMGLINDMGDAKMLVYPGKTAEGSDKGRTITVFTDINCGYCRMLHSQIDTLLEAGVSVRYLMFPRAGLESQSRTALESVWCADDPLEAMTAAKAGQPIQEASCDSPIEEHYALAEQVGLRGTPLIYLDNGTAIPGFREAADLVQMLNSTEPFEK